MTNAEKSARRRDIDWLRIAAVLLLIPFHTARVFNWEEDFYIKNVPTDVPAQRFIDFVGPWHMSLLFLLVVLGFVLLGDERIYRTIGRHWTWILCLGLTASLAYIWAEPRAGDWSHEAAVFTGMKILYEIGVWCMILGLLGLAQRFFTAGGPVLGYATEAAYPFYILHQTVIVAVAYFVVLWDRAVGLKFAAIAVASFALSLLIYEVAVRRWGPVRFLFGMKPVRKRTTGP